MAAGVDAEQSRLVLFSRTGFSTELTAAAAAGQVQLVDLPGLYGR